MKNFYYYALFSMSEKTSYGVYKKLEAQANQIKKSGFQVHTVDLTMVNKIKRCIPFLSSSVDWDATLVDSDCDVAYIRYMYSSFPFVRFLKKLKKMNPCMKTLIELPTYPYAGELKIKHLPLLIKDGLNQKHLKKYVDRIVTFSEDNEILGIPTIRVVNGIDVESIPPRIPLPQSDTVNMIAVATHAAWHGYDRLICGLGEYYKNGGSQNVVFHVVGNGTAISEYKKLVERYALNSHVIFYGNKVGRELDEIYNKCDIGVASLGVHRIGLNYGSFLKTREYLAKGLPLITGCDIDILDSTTFSYFCQFPLDDSPIDLNRVISFYQSICVQGKKSKEMLNQEIRDFAKRTCDMSVAMRPVINFIENENTKTN